MALPPAAGVAQDVDVSDLAMIWASTVAMIVATVVLFVALAAWSVGGPAPWSILPGLTRGVCAWGRAVEELEPRRLISPGAEEVPPPIDTDRTSRQRTRVRTETAGQAAWLEEDVASELLAEVDLEDVVRRRT